MHVHKDIHTNRRTHAQAHPHMHKLSQTHAYTYTFTLAYPCTDTVHIGIDIGKCR